MCPFTLILGLAFGDGLLLNSKFIKSPADLARITVPTGSYSLHLNWAAEHEDQPFFKTLCTKARMNSHLIRLGKAVNYEISLVMYTFRRALGIALDDSGKVTLPSCMQVLVAD